MLTLEMINCSLEKLTLRKSSTKTMSSFPTSMFLNADPMGHTYHFFLGSCTFLLLCYWLHLLLLDNQGSRSRVQGDLCSLSGDPFPHAFLRHTRSGSSSDKVKVIVTAQSLDSATETRHIKARGCWNTSNVLGLKSDSAVTMPTGKLFSVNF